MNRTYTDNRERIINIRECKQITDNTHIHKVTLADNSQAETNKATSKHITFKH